MYRETIDSKIMSAMRDHKEVELLVYRAIKTAFKNYESAKNAKPLDDAAELSIIRKMRDEREQDARIYIDNNRKDLAKKELLEAKILDGLLPVSPGKLELEKELAAYCFKKEWYVEDLNGQATVVIPKKSMGEAIKYLKKMFPTADGKEISDLVKGWLPDV